MNGLLIILLAILFILVILRLSQNRTYEGFQTLNPEFIKNYDTFVDFYNQFMVNWEKTIISSMVADIEQIPATTPMNPVKNTPPTPSRIEINRYIKNMSSNLNIELPQITDLLPKDISQNMLLSLQKTIPTDKKPYMNALNWMNTQMEKSQQNLGAALSGTIFSSEGFEDICANLTECISNNPDLLTKLTAAQKAQENNAIQKLQSELRGRMNNFISDELLMSQNKRNQELINQVENIKAKAQSGELINEINIPGSKTKAIYTIPDGGNALSELQKNNPTKYKELESTNKHMFQLKQLLEQINLNL